MSENIERQLLEALRYLSARCDGAHSQDGNGFNGHDSRFGKGLALRTSLMPNEARAAWALLRKYRKQLMAGGIDYSLIPEPEAVNPRYIATEGNAFAVIYPYSDLETVNPRLKTFKSREYRKNPSRWVIPARPDNAGSILDFARELGFEVSAKAEALFELMTANQAATSANGNHANGVGAKVKGRLITEDFGKGGQPVWKLYFPFDHPIYVCVKKIPEASYNHIPQPVWSVPQGLAETAAVYDIFQEFGFITAPSAEARMKAKWEEFNKEKLEKAREQRAIMIGAADITKQTFGGKAAYEYQVEGVNWLIHERRGILADDMGLGKTFQAMLVARAYKRAFGQELTVYVVCPKSLRRDWVKEAKACGVAIEVFTWAKLPSKPPGPFVLFLDEAHYAQNMRSARTKAAVALSKSPHCKGLYPISGTEMRGARPANLWPLLVMILHTLGLTQREYEKRYCNAHVKSVPKGKTGERIDTWDATGRANMEELRRLTAPKILRRKTEKVLPQLPSLTRIVREVEISEEAQALYDTEFKRMQNEYNLKLAMSLARAAAGESEKGDIKEGGEMLVLLMHLRQAAALAKCEAVMEMVEEIVEQGHSVCVYSMSAVAAGRMHELCKKAGFKSELLTGQDKEEEREQMVIRFQNRQSQVWISTVTAGGVGLTLTAANHLILIDRPWMIDDVQQVEKRINRIGQTVKTTAIWIDGFEIDKKVDPRLMEQETAKKAFEAGDMTAGKRIKTMHQIAAEVARELFGDKAKKAVA